MVGRCCCRVQAAVAQARCRLSPDDPPPLLAAVTSTTIAANALAPRLGASFQRVIEDAIAIDAETGQMKAVAKYFCKFSQATISEEFLTNPDFLEVLISGLDDPPHLIEEWTPVLQH